MTAVVVDLVPDTAGHLALALGRYRAALDNRGRAFPPELRDLEQRAREIVRSGHRRPGADTVRLYAQPDLRDREYLSTAEVAAVTGVSERTIRRWISDGALPSARAGRLRRVARRDLDALMEAPAP